MADLLSPANDPINTTLEIDMEKPIKSLNNWLQTQDGKAYLRECARNLVRIREKHMRSQDKVLWDTFASEQNILDLSTELFLFLNDNLRAFDTIQAIISTGNMTKAIGILCLKFKNHLKDLERGAQGNFFSNLYRKIQLSLSRHDAFTVSSQKGMSFYAALREADLPIIQQNFFQANSIEDYPYPEKESKWEGEKDIVAWAGFFWDRTRERSGYDCLIPVREYTFYLISKKCVHDETVSFADSTYLDEQGQQVCIYEFIADPYPGTGISSELLEGLAMATVQGWDDKTCKAFYLYYNKQMTLEETAAAVGYSGPSGVRNIIRQAIHSIRDITSAWPGFYEDNMNEEAGRLFLENIFLLCKSRSFDHKL
ncbi:hypothetical protein [Desulfonatronovibrio magnus]|uniref:hypothetical protein n=1 Tax=Desulfonatronovibrio magnus TaxID=698827 RepID=UPI0005EBEA35|nr:hypothetical protein [Desulfonatronovibrio magnus]